MSSENRVTARMLLGLAITAWGLLLAADALDLVVAEQFLRFWPVILVALGIFLLTRVGDGGPWFPGAVLILIGVGLILREFGYLERGLDSIWPLIIILLGLAIMSRGLRPRRSRDPDSGDRISKFAVLSGYRPRIESQQFKGGDLTAFMGGCEIDLTGADIGPEEAVIDVFVLMGGIDITVPPNWTVESRVTPFMGGMEDSTEPAASDPDKRLLIKGFVMMGGLEIKN